MTFTVIDIKCSLDYYRALLANETSCDSWIKPLEDNCCPNTNSNSGCEFCDAGLDNPTLKLPVTGITCEQFKARQVFWESWTQKWLHSMPSYLFLTSSLAIITVLRWRLTGHNATKHLNQQNHYVVQVQLILSAATFALLGWKIQLSLSHLLEAQPVRISKIGMSGQPRHPVAFSNPFTPLTVL